MVNPLWDWSLEQRVDGSQLQTYRLKLLHICTQLCTLDKGPIWGRNIVWHNWWIEMYWCVKFIKMFQNITWEQKVVWSLIPDSFIGLRTAIVTDVQFPFGESCLLACSPSSCCNLSCQSFSQWSAFTTLEWSDLMLCVHRMYQRSNICEPYFGPTWCLLSQASYT